MVKALHAADLGKRVVVTMFNCSGTATFLKENGMMPVDEDRGDEELDMGLLSEDST